MEDVEIQDPGLLSAGNECKVSPPALADLLCLLIEWRRSQSSRTYARKQEDARP